MVLPRIASALRRTARIACERRIASVWTLLALTAAMFAVGVAALTADHVDRWTQVTQTPGRSSMVIYLGEGVDETRARGLATELAKLPGIEKAELVPAAESATRLQQALGADASLLDGVELQSLPASVEVTLAPGMHDVIAMSPTLRALRGSTAVEDIAITPPGHDQQLGPTLSTVRTIAWTGATLFAGLALLVALAMLRLRFERSERELAVAHLLGASPTFWFVPVALSSALQGMLAAVLALGALLACIHRYGESISTSLQGLLGQVEVTPPEPILCLAFVAAGACIGLVGGALAGAARASR